MTNKSVHVTFDNSDGKQQTLIRDNTTHDTYGTIYQLNDQNPIYEFSSNINDEIEDKNEEPINFGNF